VALDLEEVGRPDVVVALLLARVNGAQVHPGGEARLQRVFGGDNVGIEDLEVPAHLADHHVLDGEADVRVDGVDGPLAGHVARNLDGLGGHHLSFAAPHK
jgi:hypothetical protein